MGLRADVQTRPILSAAVAEGAHHRRRRHWHKKPRPVEPFSLRAALQVWLWLLTLTLVGGALAIGVLWMLRFWLDEDLTHLP